MRPSHIADDHTASDALAKSDIGQDDGGDDCDDYDDGDDDDDEWWWWWWWIQKGSLNSLKLCTLKIYDI